MTTTTIQKIVSECECAYLNLEIMKNKKLNLSPRLKAQMIETFHIYEGQKPVSQSRGLVCPGKRGVSLCGYGNQKGTKCTLYPI